MGIALGNMSRMERGEAWSQGQNVTPKIGRLLEELDRERLAIAAATTPPMPYRLLKLAEAHGKRDPDYHVEGRRRSHSPHRPPRGLTAGRNGP
jgi:hypothetical protein